MPDMMILPVAPPADALQAAPTKPGAADAGFAEKLELATAAASVAAPAQPKKEASATNQLTPEGKDPAEEDQAAEAGELPGEILVGSAMLFIQLARSTATSVSSDALTRPTAEAVAPVASAPQGTQSTPSTGPTTESVTPFAAQEASVQPGMTNGQTDTTPQGHDSGNALAPVMPAQAQQADVIPSSNTFIQNGMAEVDVLLETAAPAAKEAEAPASPTPFAAPTDALTSPAKSDLPAPQKAETIAFVHADDAAPMADMPVPLAAQSPVAAYTLEIPPEFSLDAASEPFQQQVVHQIIDQVEASVKAGEQQLNLRFKPEILEGLAVRMQLSQDGLHVQLLTQGRTVQSLVNSQLAALEESLRGRGLIIQSIEVVDEAFAASLAQPFSDSQQQSARQWQQPGHSNSYAASHDQAVVPGYDHLLAGMTAETKAIEFSA